MEAQLRKEFAGHILDKLNDGVLDEANEIHFHCFNEDYYIIGYYDSEQWLKRHNISAFDAIGEIVEYEKSNFGEVTTDVSSPEKVVNMYAYIKGEEFLGGLAFINDFWDESLNEETKQELREELEAIIED